MRTYRFFFSTKPAATSMVTTEMSTQGSAMPRTAVQPDNLKRLEARWLRMLFAAVLLLLAASPAAFANTNYVIQGATNFQATIDASAPGDTLVVQGAQYFENLTFSKPITVLRSGTNLIQLQGTVQILGTGALNFAQAQFANTVFVQCTGTVSFSQCAFLSPLTSQSGNLLFSQANCAGAVTANLSTGGGTNLQAFDSNFHEPNGNGLSVTGGKVLMKRSIVNGFVLSGSAALEALRMTNNLNTTATAPNGSSPSFLAVQSVFYASVSLSNYKVWMGYDNHAYPYGSLQLTNCDAVVVGNKVNTAFNPQALYVQGGNLKAYNNQFESNGPYAVWLRSVGGGTELVNNTIVAMAGSSALYLSDGGGPITLRGSILYFYNAGGYFLNTSGGQSVNMSYCATYGLTGTGVPLCPTCVYGANVVDPNTFIPGPPCIGAGPPEAIYNNRGTIDRNDIGWTGGPLYNPANFTNSNPMVFLLTGSPQNVFKGVQTNIQVNAAAAAGH
jgi:hypothetical protein